MIETKNYVARGSIGQKNKPRWHILNGTMSRTLLFMNETRKSVRFLFIKQKNPIAIHLKK